MAVLLTNLGTDLINNDVRNQLSVIKRFNKLPFKNKLIFSSLDYKMDNVVVLKGYFKVRDKKNIWATKNIFGKRYIDQFDYVSFFNSLNK